MMRGPLGENRIRALIHRTQFSQMTAVTGRRAELKERLSSYNTLIYLQNGRCDP